MKITNTPYDDVFRTLLNDCSALIIPVINEVFGECQSSPDDSMLVRFFEYDTQIALDEGEIRGNVLTVTLPHSAALLKIRQKWNLS